VKLVDTADLKSAAFLHKGRTGSIPVPGTSEKTFVNPPEGMGAVGYLSLARCLQTDRLNSSLDKSLHIVL